MNMAPDIVKDALRGGLLSFPATPFSGSDELLADKLGVLVEQAIENKAAAVFPACGAGEFPALSLQEFEISVRTTVEAAAGRIPVIAGVGYGTPLALEFARNAAKAGADGLLIFPPYLVTGASAGLFAHVSAICDAVPIATIVYSRNNGVLSPGTIEQLADRHQNLIGFKDGHGDLENAAVMRPLLGDRLTYIGGMPTAEIYATAYKAIGFDTYSSAIFNFIPGFAGRYFRAVENGDADFIDKALKTFFYPYCALRNRNPGYAVSVIKAGLALTGNDFGPVRAPLVDLSPEERDTLAALIDVAVSLQEDAS